MAAMSENLSVLLEDYLERRASGEEPAPEEYREKAGADYGRFVELLAAESAMDAAMEIEPAAPLPRTFGGYTLLRELGRGAVGIVYEALHRELGRTVAVKVLRTGFDTTPEAIARFKREAVACAQVRHDHIVEVYEAGEVEDRPFYAMTLLRGRSLGQVAKDGDLPEPRELCGRMAGVADALQQLHEAGIVHRDIKPHNIMVEPSGRMVLADFGLARTVASEQLTQTGDTLGTPLYMSPEQLMGQREQISGRTDVYGLGATLYEVLAKQPVFHAKDMRELMHMILEARPKPVCDVAPDVPRACEHIVMKSLEKRGEDRYESAAALRDDLLAASRGEAVSGRPVSGLQRGMRRARRLWLPASAAAALLIAFLWWQSQRPGTLSIGSYPTAMVFVNGEERGETPLNIELSPGDHTITLKSEGFKDVSQPLHMAPKEKHTKFLPLVALDQDDPQAFAKLAQKFQLAMLEFETVARTRGVMDEIDAMYPAGAVRIEDVKNYRIDVSPEFEQPGLLRFLVDKKIVYAEPFDPENLTTVAELPAGVLKLLKPGVTCVWGFWPLKGEPTTRMFKVQPHELDEQLAEIGAALDQTNPGIADLMRAQLFVKYGFHLAAYNAARKVGDSVYALRIMQHALRGMGLENTPVWAEWQRRFDALPSEHKSK